jgi:alkylation response protein AidB-like acyl-CoA dehydrogenase
LSPAPITLSGERTATGPLTDAVSRSSPDGIGDALALAVELSGPRVVPGAGATRDLWEALATLAGHDVAVARAVEPHWDAVAILLQAGRPTPPGAWGVFAAEGGPYPVTAVRSEDCWELTGVKPWCSLADRLDAALVTASTETGDRRLFAVELRSPAVTVERGVWAARGLTEVPSGPIRLERAPADPIGEPEWYLRRPGFEFGAIGVAACWFGGAVGIARAVHAAAVTKPNPFLLEHLGRIDQLLQDARRALAEAADLVDGGAADSAAVAASDPDLRILAKRVRATVVAACEEILGRAGHALGPAPLALDERYAKRVADLQLYIRQHHAERDLESLGRALAEGPAPW